MGWLSSFFSNLYQTMQNIPGSPEAVTQSVIDGSGSDGLSWNPFYQEGPSVWDRGALGYNLSDQNQEREHGRMVGRAIGDYVTGGYLETLLAPMETKAHGGSDKDALRAGGKAYALAGANSYLNGLDGAGAMGIENPVYKGAVNGALSSGATSALTGGNSTQIGQSMVKGGTSGGLRGYQGGGMDYEEGGYSRAPWARDNSFVDGGSQSFAPYNPSTGGTYFGSNSNPAGSAASENPFSSYIDKALGLYKNPDGSWNGKNIDSTVNGLMGLYGGYKRRQAASSLMRGMNQRRNDYGTALQAELMRKDAAAGRRSAYDTRGVELNARLAALDAQQAPALMNAKNSELSGLFNMLSSGYGMARGMGAFNQPYQSGNFQTPSLGELPQIQPQQEQLDPGVYSPYTLSGGYNAMRRRPGYTGGI